MTTVHIEGYDVRFPFDPYPAQVEYMQAVLKALDTGANALLESPTGTGKTLCLLCATLAWTLAQQRSVARHPRYDPTTGVVDVDSNQGYRILYCSRTHAQLTQVIRELKRALRTRSSTSAPSAEDEQQATERAWSEVSMALLGSREHMCVNAEVSRLPSSHTQQSMCNALRADKRCRFFNSLQINKAEGCLPTTAEGDAVYDMEDLVREGKKSGFCPYYLERDLAKTADIVFMPYNYVLDNRLRKQLPFELNKKCILIVDEAHNLPNVLSASGCLNLQPLELASAIQDCTRAIAMQRLAVEKESADPQREMLLAEEFASLKILLARLEACILAEDEETSHCDRLKDEHATNGGRAASSVTTAHPLPPRARGPSVEGEVVRPGAYMEAFLAKALITREMFEGTSHTTGMNNTIDNAVAVLMESEKPAGGLAHVQRFLSAVFSSPTDESTRFVLQEIESTNSTRPHDRPNAGSINEGVGRRQRWRSLGFWRLDNSADVVELSNQTHCLLLTSGTLSPLEHFAAELGAPFPVRLRGSHVIAPDQVLGSVLCRGPTGDRLNGSYATRNSVEYRTALGMTLVNISRVTPGGTLVFFPSYAALNSAAELWRAGAGNAGEAKTIWGLLTELKPVFVEPSGSGDLAPVVAEFQKAVRESPRKGAILLAVCRGKVSEGIDFADNDGRCVMVTGIPYANHTDLFVRLKREYLSAVAPQRPHVNGKLFTGDTWYRQEAMRAVNQSIGRVIRHKSDYGAIVLADERFTDMVSDGCLSDWVATRTSVHRDFRACYPAVANFFPHHFHDRHVLGGAVRGTRLGTETVEASSVVLSPSASSGDAVGAGEPPSSAALAKQYALKQEREAMEAAEARRRRRLEEAEERPTHEHRPMAAPPGSSSASPPQTGSPLPTQTLPRMEKQTLGSLVAANRTPAPTFPAGQGNRVSSAVLFPPGSTSKEFCAFLKARVAAETYETFKGLLREIADMRRALRGGEAGNPAASAAVRKRFEVAVDSLRHVFTEAAGTQVQDVLLEFGRHIPEEFSPIYAHLARRNTHAP